MSLAAIGGEGFADLVGEHESRLVLAIQVAGELQGAMSLRAIHEDRDGQEDVADWHFPACEDGAGRDAELVRASFAFPQLADLYLDVAAPQRGQTGSPLVSVQRISRKAL